MLTKQTSIQQSSQPLDPLTRSRDPVNSRAPQPSILFNGFNQFIHDSRHCASIAFRDGHEVQSKERTRVGQCSGFGGLKNEEIEL
jgi:hypothetical protein